MKKELLFAVLVGFILSVQAQGWETNINKANSRATEENKEVLLVFSGSDWCVPCMRMEQEVFENKEFLEYAEENLILLKADFPKLRKNELLPEQQQHNNRLAEMYNREGFLPKALILNVEGKILGSFGYSDLSINDYLTFINQVSN